MSNMSYCRFQNTLTDLRDCQDSIGDDGLSLDENEARKELIRVCREIAEDITSDDLDRTFRDEDCDDYIDENGDE